MSSLTQVQKIRLEHHEGIVLIRGETISGDAIYAYIKADKQGIEKIYRLYEKGEVVDFSEYQGIIKHDWGSEPTENVKKYMENFYNFKHE